jgi:DNA repair protein RecO (recombination protein O)
VSTSADILGAWLLHSRPFRETSLLVDFLTRERGRCTAIARGVKSPRSQRRGLLQPFIPLQITLSGRNELQNLGNVDALGYSPLLTGERLFAALYVNELLVRLLPVHEPALEIFDAYTGLLSALAGTATLEPLLRNFELDLLESLGYGLQFTHDADSGEDVVSEAWYGLSLESGFVLQERMHNTAGPHNQPLSFSGRALLAINARDFADSETRKVAKRLLRHVLQQHLGNRELASRDLFRHGD